MLRSFNYALFSALARSSTEQPGAMALLESLGLDWEAEVRRSFLRGYKEATQGSNLFGSWADMERLLQLFTLEKAFYELGYEMNNRPDWLRIPLLGVEQLLSD